MGVPEGRGGGGVKCREERFCFSFPTLSELPEERR